MSNKYEERKLEEGSSQLIQSEEIQAEAYNSFGNTEAYRESHERTANYSKEDFKEILEKGNRILTKLSMLMDRDPTDPEVQALVAEWRKYISESFYNCTIEILRGLGQGYLLDPRFKKNIDKVKVGLAEFLSKAIKHYCEHFR